MSKFESIAGGVTAAAGFRAGGMHCGIKKNGAPDLAILVSDTPANVAGVVTRNLVKSAAVLHTQRVLHNGILRAVVMNSGNANAATGQQGMRDAETMARTVAQILGAAPEEVAVASTGTIGVMLPMEKITKGIKKLSGALHQEGGDEAARAIMTTDTFPKSVALKVRLSAGEIIIGGMAKGAGMICPDMATMLAFVTTDAKVEPSLLTRALKEAVDGSFNSITVDGDGSTNDTLLLAANGASGVSINTISNDYHIFCSALENVCSQLARMLIQDGEGATKLVEITVSGARRKPDAKKIAMTIANSLLVKTAIFGSDANWGRIVAAAGRAGVDFEPERMEVRLSDLLMFRNGVPVNFDEARAKQLLSEKEIPIVVDLHQGKESATVLTCDLSFDYIKINASYRS